MSMTRAIGSFWQTDRDPLLLADDVEQQRLAEAALSEQDGSHTDHQRINLNVSRNRV
jgi:hypothetical protein